VLAHRDCAPIRANLPGRVTCGGVRCRRALSRARAYTCTVSSTLTRAREVGRMCLHSHEPGTTYERSQLNLQGQQPHRPGGPYPCGLVSACPSKLTGFTLVGRLEFMQTHRSVEAAAVVVVFNSCLIQPMTIVIVSPNVCGSRHLLVRIIRARIRVFSRAELCTKRRALRAVKRHRAQTRVKDLRAYVRRTMTRPQARLHTCEAAAAFRCCSLYLCCRPWLVGALWCSSHVSARF
jgi:hypothetical protein